MIPWWWLIVAGWAGCMLGCFVIFVIALVSKMVAEKVSEKISNMIKIKTTEEGGSNK